MKQEYLASVENVLQAYETGEHGLSGTEAAERLAKMGRNKLAEGKKLHLVNVRVGIYRFLQQKNIILIIVKRWDYDLAHGGGDIFFREKVKEAERGIDAAADVFSVIGIVCVLYIKQNTVADLKKGKNTFVYDAARRIEAGVDAVLLAQREQLTDKIRLK